MQKSGAKGIPGKHRLERHRQENLYQGYSWNYRRYHNGDILNAPTKKIPHFDFEVPTELPGVDPAILDPRDTYADASEWETKAKDLASRFVKNFAKYEGNPAGKALVSAGPKE